LPYKVELSEDAAADFRSLYGSLKKPVAVQLRKLEQSPQLGKPLGNKRGVDLTGYFKVYAVKKSIRIIYRIIEDRVVVDVVGIGKRADFEVYAEVVRRLTKK